MTAFKNTGRSFLLALATAAALSACASGGLRGPEKLALYRAHAGEPVSSFNYMGRINGWSPLSDSALAVWTRPNEAFLLELFGPCLDLEYTPVIGITSQMNRVHARFDKVLVRSTVGTNMPCNIQTIHPLDLSALKASEKELREANVQERDAES